MPYHEWEKSVSSSTSSSEANRSYTLWVLALAFVPGLLLFIYGIYLQPLYGDLTRIGLFSEREFGWQGTQQTFKEAAYIEDQYKRQADVVVLGDSFSRAWPRQQWQNHLIAQTGWSVVTLDINKVTVDQILANPVFQASPPKVLIVESVERYFADRIGKMPACVPANTVSATRVTPALATEPLHPRELPSSPMQRPQQWNDVKLEFVWKYVRNQWRQLRGDEPRTDVRKLALQRSGLFTSANQRDILIYKEDFDTRSKWSTLALNEISCRVQQLRSKVERHSRTRFVLMVAPDKLTAYGPELQNTQWAHASKLPALAALSPQTMPRLDLALSQAIARGQQDVYLPDDTHWGSEGHRLAADTIRGFLSQH